MKSYFACLLSPIFLSACMNEQAHVEKSISWNTNGQSYVADLHSHSRFSDGNLAMEDLVFEAVTSGCQVFAVTDHSDQRLKSGEAAYLEKFNQLRERYPGLTLFAGLELNPQQYNGREHISLIMLPEDENKLSLAKTLFENSDNTTQASFSAFSKQAPDALFIYNHPSRKDVNKLENKTDFIGWNKAAPQLIGFEGGPGHQKNCRIGSYGGPLKLSNRWDPAVAHIGGAWDQLLSAGFDVWGAFSNSDYHNNKLDFSPCSFSRTHIKAASRQPSDIFNALKAGTFWASYGDFLTDLELLVRVNEGQLFALVGETIKLNGNKPIEVVLALSHQPSKQQRPITTEFISNCTTGSSVVIAKEKLIQGNKTSTVIQHPVPGDDGKSCYIRARLSYQDEKLGKLFAYTNSIRIKI